MRQDELGSKHKGYFITFYKFCITDTFVVINPYLFFKGNKIHKFIYDMFDAIGYKHL